jgi:uracil-DNA glycosylase family 4
MRSPPPTAGETDPSSDCALCPRLVDYRRQLSIKQPAWRNAPVANFGDADARLLIVGLAPGSVGANRTGRPFAGDYGGALLHATLSEFAFLRGVYGARVDDGLELSDSLISNAVRCVPPQNKPRAAEIAAYRPFLANTIAKLHRLCAVVALGRVAHDSVIGALSFERAPFPFSHGAEHVLVTASGRKLRLFDSYHCSRYNMSTGVLTPHKCCERFSRAHAPFWTCAVAALSPFRAASVPFRGSNHAFSPLRACHGASFPARAQAAVSRCRVR